MEKPTLLKIGFETAILLNVLSIVAWIFLSIFSGLFYLSQGDIWGGFQAIFLNIWFYLFIITLGIALFLRSYVDKEEKEKEPSEKK